jgi:hypothetical protein
VTPEQVSKDLDNHVTRCEARALEYDSRCKADDIRHAQLIECIDKLTTSTQGVVDAWIFASTFRKVAMWLTGFAAAAVTVWVSLIDKLPHIKI